MKYLFTQLEKMVRDIHRKRNASNGQEVQPSWFFTYSED